MTHLATGRPKLGLRPWTQSHLLQQQIERDRPIGVLLIDLDHFKSINGRFGHTVGDRVLQIFARTAQANLRQSDLVGRLGGEEFVVVLADAGIDNAYLVADRLRNAFAVGSTTRRCTRPRASACR